MFVLFKNKNIMTDKIKLEQQFLKMIFCFIFSCILILFVFVFYFSFDIFLNMILCNHFFSGLSAPSVYSIYVWWKFLYEKNVTFCCRHSERIMYGIIQQLFIQQTMMFNDDDDKKYWIYILLIEKPTFCLVHNISFVTISVYNST